MPAATVVNDPTTADDVRLHASVPQPSLKRCRAVVRSMYSRLPEYTGIAQPVKAP